MLHINRLFQTSNPCDLLVVMANANLTGNCVRFSTNGMSKSPRVFKLSLHLGGAPHNLRNAGLAGGIQADTEKHNILMMIAVVTTKKAAKTIYFSITKNFFIHREKDLITDLVILNHGQVTRTTPRWQPLLPHHSNGKTFEPRYISRASASSARWILNSTKLELMTRNIMN
ncbi:hypothetical protein TNCV_3542711 [Trichonephila clavipes]|nr:hypothetical protein TNCV_3542711 [Trichonephila clavipes]